MPARKPVEAKVKAATMMATFVGVVVTILNSVVADSELLGSMPPALQGFITLVAPPLAVFWAGWQARHTPQS